MDLDDWYRRYAESIYRRCLRLCRDEQQAHDLAQEVFLRAHRYRESYRGDAAPLTWLLKLADHCFFDTLSKPAPTSRQELESFVRGEELGFEGDFMSHDLVARLLSRSADDVRAIVVHRYFDELELDAIAERVGLNERTVRRKLLRFLENARKLARSSS